MAVSVKRNKGTPEEYDDAEVHILTEAGIWLEYLPGDNKWIQIPVVVTDTPQGRFFKVADIQAAVETTFQSLRGQYMKIYKATYDGNADPDSLRPTVDYDPERGWHNREAPKPLSSVDKVSTGYYFICDPGTYPQQYLYTVYCPAKNVKYPILINSTDQKVHMLKRYYLHYSYDLNDMPLAGIPEELLEKVRITNYQSDITEADIDSYIEDQEKDPMTKEIGYWNTWTNDLTLIWDAAIQASPYMWVARIYTDESFHDTLPTLTAGGVDYYPKSYNDNEHDTHKAQGDSRASSSPTPKRMRTVATSSQ